MNSGSIPLLEIQKLGFHSGGGVYKGPDVWQFRWSETRLDGKRSYHKKIVGTVEQYPDEDAARRSVVGLVSELIADGRSTNSGVLTVAQLCDHFEQRELSQNTWRSHATKKIYQAYLSRWIRPHWQKYGLAEVRTIQVASWLQSRRAVTALRQAHLALYGSRRKQYRPLNAPRS